jgi:hypothetical protein
MKKEHLILLAAGVILACLLYRAGRKSSIISGVIKPGDKGNDVYGLQYALISIAGLKFNNVGAYDTDTLNAVRYYMEGTAALVDYDKGYVKKDFANDLYLIKDKLKKEQ